METNAAAPSAAPTTTAPAAPSAAPAATIPNGNSLEHFSALAKADLLKSAPAPAPAATEPPAAVPPVAPALAAPVATPPAVPVPIDPNVAPAAPEPAAPVQTPGEDDEPEPTAEEQANWTDGEKRLHGALVKERAARKEAKNELKGLKQELEGIKAKLPPENPNPEQPTRAAEHQSEGVALGDCHTFESVDARVTQAAMTETFAKGLQRTLAKQGAAPVVEALKQKGITQIGGVPAAEIGDEGLSEFLTTVEDGARITQTQAAPRKQFLVNQAQAWQEAVKQMPELADGKSDRAKRFVQMANENPAIRNMGPNWPVVLVYQVLGREAAAAKAAPAAAAPAPVIKPTPTPVPAPTRQVPAAPRATPPAAPKKNEYEQASEKLATGKATLADITAMAKAALVSNGG